METTKTEIKLEVPFEEKISRLFIFRFLWIYIAMWPILVWAIWIGLVSFVHFWYMLVLGTRHHGMWSSKIRFFRHVTKWQSYINNYIDQRPKFIED